MVKSLCGMWYDHDNFRGSDRMEFERLYAPSLKDLFVQQLQDMEGYNVETVNVTFPRYIFVNMFERPAK